MTFVILLTRAILSFDLNLLIPISKVSKKPWTGRGGGGEDTVTCQLENLILSLRVSVRAFPGRCGATLGWTPTPQRAHPPTLLPPPEPRGINYSASASMEHFAQIRYFDLVAITKSACETFYFSGKTSTNALI